MLEKDAITFEEFVDLEGQVYKIKNVTENNTTETKVTENNVRSIEACSHNYVNGFYKRHTAKSDGSCVVATYHAQICSICGTVVVGSLYSTSSYPACPH